MKVVQITVLGQPYAVRSDLDPAYVGALAEYLDGKMRLAARELATADPLRVAVLAALNVTDELFRARDDSAGSHERWTERAQAIEAILDAVLNEPPGAAAVNG